MVAQILNGNEVNLWKSSLSIKMLGMTRLQYEDPKRKGFRGNRNKIEGHDWLTETGIPQKPFEVGFQIAISLLSISVGSNHCHEVLYPSLI